MKDKVVKRLSQSGCTNIISLVFINFWNALMCIIFFLFISNHFLRIYLRYIDLYTSFPEESLVSAAIESTENGLLELVGRE